MRKKREILKVEEQPYCCFISCQANAEFEIRDGETVDDFTHACRMHIGEMLRSDRISTIYKLAA